MSKAPAESLEELLEALGRTRKLSERLRVLGHSWRLLRSLAPSQREQVGLRLGSRWAWKRLERTLSRDGELSEDERLLGRVFERLGDSDPGELRALAAAVRGGDREGLKDMLMIELHEALESEVLEETAAVEGGAGEAEAVAGESGERDLDGAPAPEAPAPPEPTRAETDLVDTLGGVLASARARGVEPVAEPARARGVDPVAEPARARGVDPVAARRAPRAASETVAAPEPAAWTRERPQLPELPPAPQAPFPPRLDGLDPGGADRLRALRSLAREARPGASLGRAGRARLVASLGGGWASRRALSRMIAADGLDDLAEALELIGGLTRAGQQAWCLGDLVARGDLDAPELERVLEAAPSDATRRRLARRAKIRAPGAA